MMYRDNRCRNCTHPKRSMPFAFLFALAVVVKLGSGSVTNYNIERGEERGLLVSSTLLEEENISGHDRRELQDVCDNYFQELVDNEFSGASINFSEDSCSCENLPFLKCHFEDICIGTSCASAVGVSVDLHSSISERVNGETDFSSTNRSEDVHVHYCVDYETRYKSTCVHLTISTVRPTTRQASTQVTSAINDDGFYRYISSCNRVTFGGPKCGCEVCKDGTSLDIDCSEYDPTASTNGCQTFDFIQSSVLIPLIPNFGGLSTPDQTQKPQQEVVQGGDDIAVTDGDGDKTSTVPNDTSEQTDVVSDIDQDSDSDMDQDTGINMDQDIDVEGTSDSTDVSCGLVQVVRDRIPNVEEICTCYDQQRLDCRMQILDSSCAGDSASLQTTDANPPCSVAEFVGMSIDSSEGLVVTNCVSYNPNSGTDEAPLDEICVSVTLDINLNIGQCREATYGAGNQNCLCTVCEDKQSLSLDCTAYNLRAITAGCQPVNFQQLEPFVPDFSAPRIVVDGAQDNNSAGVHVSYSHRSYLGVVLCCLVGTLFFGL